MRLKANLMFHEHPDIDENGSIETTWTPYSNISFGLIGVGGEIGNFARLYGEGGFILLLPNNEFSSESNELGGYGLFGFEFYTYEHFNYFIELGATGTGAVADKVAGNPIYSNGFLINVGFRFLL